MEGWAEMLLLPTLDGMKEAKSFQRASKPAQRPAPDRTPASFSVSALMELVTAASQRSQDPQGV